MSRQFWAECIAWSTASGTAVANSTTETILMPNITIPANYLQDGRTLRLTLRGQIGATATPTMTFRIRWGGVSGTVLAASAAVTLAAATAAIFKIEAEMTVRTNGATGTVLCMGTVQWGATIKTTNTPDMMGSAGASSPSTATVDLTADTALAITAQWGTANASNTVQGMGYLLESLN